MTNQVIIKKEMGLSHSDFFRTINNAIGDKKLQVMPSGVVLKKRNKDLKISLGAERTRRIGSLIFPVTDVTMIFNGYTRKEIELVVKRFNLRFKRGGG